MIVSLHQWSEKLDEATRLAAASKWRRLMYNPGTYLGAMAFRHIIYPLTGKPQLRRCRTFFGAEMEVALPAGMDLYLLGCKTHDSELRLARFLMQFLRPGDVVADVGAHFGFFTLLAAFLCEAQGRVFAFEPGEANFGVLQRNVAAFPHVEARRILVGSREGQLPFWEFPTLFSEYNTTNPEAVPAHLEGRRVELPSVSLDVFFERAGVSPRLVKIDVEGAEYDVLLGMKELIRSKAPPVIAMEYIPGHSHRKAAEVLFEWGVRAYVADAVGQLQPCTDLDKYMLQQGIDSENFVFLPQIPNFAG